MATSAMLRVVNQARILSALRRPRHHSRVSLAHDLGLTRSTVTVVVSALIEQGLVEEVFSGARHPNATGRPRVEVALRSSGAYFGGLDLGNEMLTAVIVDLRGRVLAEAQSVTPSAASPRDVEGELCRLLRALLTKHPGVALSGIGMTVPGQVRSAGELIWAPILGWREVVLGSLVRSEFEVPIRVENDANAAAVAEVEFSGHPAASNMLYVLLSSGVGAGLIVNGDLYTGTLGRVGEVGHIRIPDQFGLSPAGHTVEELLSSASFLRQAQRSVGPDWSWQRIGQAGVTLPSEIVQMRAEWQRTLAWLTSSLVWALDPEIVLFGGEASALLEYDRTVFDAALRSNGVPDIEGRCRLATFHRRAVQVAAAGLATRAFFAIPTDIFSDPGDSPVVVAS